MQTRPWFGLLWALCPIVAACYADRPLYVAVSPDGSQSGTAGTAGGSAGTSGGSAGLGAVPPGCDQATQIFTQHSCSLNGSCHDAMGSAAGLNLSTPGWEQRLVGRYPAGGGALPSMCVNVNRPYLLIGSSPATGLFLDKLRNKTPPCGAQMPNLPPVLNASELDCIQRWADKLTSTVSGPIPAPSVDGDGRLVDPSSANQGFGWDTCFAKPVLTKGPRSPADPAPTKGDTYLVARPIAPNDTTVPQTEAQAYFWWTDNRPVRGLWFDLALLDGSASGASLIFYDTNVSCGVQRKLGDTYVVENARPSAGAWRTGCVDLGGTGALDRLGIRLEAPNGTIGLDGLRFAEPCH